MYIIEDIAAECGGDLILCLLLLAGILIIEQREKRRQYNEYIERRLEYSRQRMRNIRNLTE